MRRHTHRAPHPARLASATLLASWLLTACAVSDVQGVPVVPTAPPSGPTPQALSAIDIAPTLDPEAEALLLSLPTNTPYPDEERIVVGTSIEGREMSAWQFGDGPVTLALVGGIHGGYEFNTVVLVEQLAETMRSDPSLTLPGIRLVMVPSANPDGVARGRGLEGRFNANSVDLNRNWGCGWLPTSYWQDQTTSPGTHPFSEPETTALRSYLLAQTPSAVIFYHSAAEAIFVGGCEEVSAASKWLGDLMSQATGYPNEVTFDYYEVFGTADDWLDERGVPSITIELADRFDPEFARNLAGLMLLQCHFALNATGAGPLIRARVAETCDAVQPFVPDD